MNLKLGIKGIKYVYDDDRIIMLISLKPGGNGNFSEKIKLTPQISQLLIGENREIIWDKSTLNKINVNKRCPVTHEDQTKMDIKIKNRLKELQSRHSEDN